MSVTGSQSNNAEASNSITTFVFFERYIKMSNVFSADLSDAIAILLEEGRTRKAGVSAGDAVRLLTDAGYEVPGESPEMQAVNLRGLLAWVDPSVGSSKRGPKGGFAPAEFAQPASKKPQGTIGAVNALKKQGVTDEAILRALEQVAKRTSPTTASA